MLERLHQAQQRVRAEGLENLRANQDPLFSIWAEADPEGRFRRCGFHGLWLPAAPRHPGLAAQAAAEAHTLQRAVRESRHAPLRFVLWAAAGAAAECLAMCQTAGLLRKPRYYLLDSCDPAKLKAVLDDIEQRHGMGIAAALRSGLIAGACEDASSFGPGLNLEKLAGLYERHGIDPRPHFLSVAPEGSLLDCMARTRGFRRIPLRPAELPGGAAGPAALLPLALAGADLDAWIAGAGLDAGQVAECWRLASFIHSCGLAGRDKLMLLLPKEWAGAAHWTRQALERGVPQSEAPGLRVVFAPRFRLVDFHPPRDARQDRLFLAVRAAGLTGPEPDKVSALRRAGYPLAVLSLPKGAPLSQYMQTVLHTAFGLCYLRGVNGLSRPAAERQRLVADRICSEAQIAGGIEKTSAWQEQLRSPAQLRQDGITLHWGGSGLGRESATSPAELYAAILRRLIADRRVDRAELVYFGDLRYSRRGQALRRTLEHALAELFGGRLRLAAELSEGAAWSDCGQEMTAGHGSCFTTFLLRERPEAFAEARYAPDYHAAQFLAARAVLAEQHRPAVVITLEDEDDVTLAALGTLFHRAAALLKNLRV